MYSYYNMEAEIDNLSLEELKVLALQAKQNALRDKSRVNNWCNSNPDKKKEQNKKYYEKIKLKKQTEKNTESPEVKIT